MYFSMNDPNEGSIVEWPERWTCNSEVPLCPLAGFVLGSSEFKSSATLVNSQLVCLLPVGILNFVMINLNHFFSLSLKSPIRGEN